MAAKSGGNRRLRFHVAAEPAEYFGQCDDCAWTWGPVKGSVGTAADAGHNAVGPRCRAAVRFHVGATGHAAYVVRANNVRPNGEK